jgi:hypothetical protein
MRGGERAGGVGGGERGERYEQAKAACASPQARARRLEKIEGSVLTNGSGKCPVYK